MANTTSSGLERSKEADKRGLELGREQGEAMTRTIRHMIHDVADCGGEIATGEYLIGFAVEEAEGVYELKDGELRWLAPEDENVHIEVSVQDKADGRFIPGLDVEVTVIAEDGREIGSHKHPFLWHPYLYHYGRNWRVPSSGNYRFRVRFDAPRFMRHDRANGRRFAKGAECQFDDVAIKL